MHSFNFGPAAGAFARGLLLTVALLVAVVATLFLAPQHFYAVLVGSSLCFGMAVAPGMVDIQQIPLFDTFTVAAGTAIVPPVQFFTVPIGTIGSGFATAKTAVQTNLTQPQRLEAPRSFEVHALRLYVQQDVLFADLVSLYNKLVAVLVVGEKNYQQGPVWFFPAGAGITGNPTAAAQTNWQNGERNPLAINLIASPFLVKLEQGENFRVELQGTTGFTPLAAGTGLTIVAVLDGILTRQVQ